MRLLIPLVFIAIPLIEIALFVVIGREIGILATVAIVVLTAVAGTALLRHQGFTVLAQVRQAMDEGRLPLGAVADGLFLLIAGVLLLTPGFLTDALGFLLFVPQFRLLLGTKLISLFSRSTRREPMERPARSGDLRSGGSRRPPPVIEGEVIDSNTEPYDDRQ